MLSHVSALSHSGSPADREQILGRDGNPCRKSWFEDEPDGATWPGHHMAGGVAVPLKPKMKIVWGKPQSMTKASRTRRRVRQGTRGLSCAGSGKGDDETLPDIGKLSDDMDVDQDVSKRGSSRMFKSGMGGPMPRDIEAGQADPSKMNNFSGTTFKEYRKAAPTYEYGGEGDDQVPKNTPIDMEKPLPAEAALLAGQASGS